jgi:hypothetical protein
MARESVRAAELPAGGRPGIAGLGASRPRAETRQRGDGDRRADETQRTRARHRSRERARQLVEARAYGLSADRPSEQATPSHRLGERACELVEEPLTHQAVPSRFRPAPSVREPKDNCRRDSVQQPREDLR